MLAFVPTPSPITVVIALETERSHESTEVVRQSAHDSFLELPCVSVTLPPSVNSDQNLQECARVIFTNNQEGHAHDN